MKNSQIAMLVVSTALVTSLGQVLLTQAQNGPQPTPASTAPQSANIQAAVNTYLENGVFDFIWRKTFHYETFFESLQGFNVVGNTSIDSHQLILATGETAMSAAEVNKEPLWQGLNTFSERGRFRTAFTMTNPSNAEARILVGARGGMGYGFKISGGVLYGFSNDGANESTVALETIDHTKVYNIEARFKPNTEVAFYVNRNLEGEITANLPSPAKVPNPRLMDIYLQTTDNVQKSLQVSFFEYLQMRNTAQ